MTAIWMGYDALAAAANERRLLLIGDDALADTIESWLVLSPLAKARPEQLNCASAGTGSTLHLAQVLFENAAQVKFTHIPFNGSPQAAPPSVLL